MSLFKNIFSKEKKETLDKGLEKSKTSFCKKLELKEWAIVFGFLAIIISLALIACISSAGLGGSYTDCNGK